MMSRCPACVLGLVLVVVVACAAAPLAGASPFGIGGMVGEPSGVTIKNWLGHSVAIDAALAWSFHDHDALHLHADYLWHEFGIFPVDKGWLPVYYGVGARIRFEDDEDETFGIRVPVGLAYIFQARRVEIFAEFVPLLDLAPETDFDANAALGARYYFTTR